MTSKNEAFLECVKCCSQGTVRGYLSLSREPYSECQKKENEEEGAEATGDVAMRDEECDVITQRNAAFDNGRLPPRGRLKYFSGRGYDGAYAGIGATGNRTTGLYGP